MRKSVGGRWIFVTVTVFELKECFNDCDTPERLSWENIEALDAEGEPEATTL